jgi:hypothetical protein
VPRLSCSRRKCSGCLPNRTFTPRGHRHPCGRSGRGAAQVPGRVRSRAAGPIGGLARTPKRSHYCRHSTSRWALTCSTGRRRRTRRGWRSFTKTRASRPRSGCVAVPPARSPTDPSALRLCERTVCWTRRRRTVISTRRRGLRARRTGGAHGGKHILRRRFSWHAAAYRAVWRPLVCRARGDGWGLNARACPCSPAVRSSRKSADERSAAGDESQLVGLKVLTRDEKAGLVTLPLAHTHHHHRSREWIALPRSAAHGA